MKQENFYKEMRVLHDSIVGAITSLMTDFGKSMVYLSDETSDPAYINILSNDGNVTHRVRVNKVFLFAGILYVTSLEDGYKDKRFKLNACFDDVCLCSIVSVYDSVYKMLKKSKKKVY